MQQALGPDRERREAGAEPLKQCSRLGRRGLVLDRDVRAERLTVLWGQPWRPRAGEAGTEGLQLGALDRVGDPAAEEAQARRLGRERWTLAACGSGVGRD